MLITEVLSQSTLADEVALYPQVIFFSFVFLFLHKISSGICEIDCQKLVV